MSLFNWEWIRLYFQRHTRPIPVDKAALWKQRLSIVYAIVAWHAFGLVGYMIYNGKSDWAKSHGLKSEEDMKLTPAQQWTKTLGIKNATVYRVSGFNVSKYEVHNEFDDEQKLKKGFTSPLNFTKTENDDDTKLNT